MAGAEFKQLLNTWNMNYSSVLREYLLNEENQNFLKEFFTSEDGGILQVLGKYFELRREEA